MPAYTDVFGGSTVQPSDVQFSAVTLAANLATSWPAFVTTGQVLARIMKVSASAAALTITLPDATLTGAGQDVLFDNSGANTFSVLDFAGGVVTTVAPGQVKYLYLSAAVTAPGVWRTTLFGAASSALDAAALAGYGLKAIGATLNQSSTTAIISASKTFGVADRAQTYVNSGGSITGTLPLTNVLGSDYYFEIRNQGTGTVTLAPTGGELIDGSATIVLTVNDSCIVHCAAGAWYTVGRGRNTSFNFTQLTKTVTGGTNTLTLAEAANVVQNYSGTLLSNEIVVLPAVVQVYYVSNNTTGAFSFTFQSPTPGSTVVLPQGQTAVLFCNGVNVVNASTSTAGILSLLLSAGSAGSPSLALAAANNGLFAPSSTTLAVSVNGAEAGRWSGTQYQAAAGAAGAPSVSFLAYPGTGIYNPAANALGFSINAALAMTLDATGNLGIGMTPVNRLDVSGNAGITGSLTVATLAGVAGTLTYTGIQDFTSASIKVPTATVGTSTTQAASTAFVVAGFAQLASPAFTGAPTVPTATLGTNTTQVANTAFVVAGFAPLASPGLTGVPTAPTAAPGTNTTQIASTSYVFTNFAGLASPGLTGVPTAPTAAPGTSNTQLATTAFVTATAFSPALPGQSALTNGMTILSNGSTASWVPAGDPNYSAANFGGF